MNDLPVVRSPWRISDPRARVHLPLRPDADAGDSLVQQLEAGNGLGRMVDALVSEPFHDDAMMSAVGLSSTHRRLAATAAADPRYHRRGGDGALWAFSRLQRLAFMITAPLVMPDVITGLSPLLLFVALGHAIGWPSDRGMLTIWLAHVTFCTAYVAVVISPRLRELDHSIEEAAMDLGAAPLKVFFVITLPMIMPVVILRLAAGLHAVAG